MAKKLNTRFITWSTGILVGLVVLGFGARALRGYIFREPVAKMVAEQIARSDQLVKEGRTDEAVAVITSAWQIDRNNKELCVKRGDMLTLLSQQNPRVMDSARDMWEKALEIDPNYKPAATRLMNSYAENVDLAPTPLAVQRLLESAQRVVRIDPADDRARAFVPIAVIQQWVDGTGKSNEEIDAAFNTLQTLGKAHPDNPDILYYTVRGKCYRASNDYQANRGDLTAVANQMLDECRTLLEQTTKAFPDASLLNFKAFRGYALLVDTSRDPAAQARYREAAGQALSRARSTVREDDPRYADFQFVAAEWALGQNHPDEAEKILRQFYDGHKADQRARLGLARFLGRSQEVAKLKEAIAILSAPVMPLPNSVGLRALSLKELELQTLLDLTSFRIQLYSVTEAAQRADLMAKIEAGYDTLSKVPETDPVPVMRLQARIMQLKGQTVEAVDVLARALTILEHANPTSGVRYDLMMQLADAYRGSQQNHAAEKLLADIVEHTGNFNARLQLAQLLLDDNNDQDAQRHIAILTAQNPTFPDVVRLDIRFAQHQGQDKAAREFYDKLPEQTLAQRYVKFQLSHLMHDGAESVRLLEMLHADKPDDIALIGALVEGYQHNSQHDKASTLLADSLKLHPGDSRLLLVQQEIEGGSPDAPERAVEKVLAAQDPFYAQIIAGRQALADGKFAEALEHAKAADQKRPNDAAAWDLYFQIYRRQQNWDQASAAIDVLAKLDSDHAGGRIYRWQVAMDRAQYTDAINIGRDLTEVRGTFGQSWMYLAQAYQANGQYHEAIDQYQAALERQTTNIETWIGMAQCYEALSLGDRERETLVQGRKLFPDSIRLREALLNYDQNLNPVSVIAARQKLLEQGDGPKDPENYVALASALMHASMRIQPVDPKQAFAYVQQARDVLTRGVGKFPDHLRLNAALAEALQNANQYTDGVKILLDLSERPAWKDRPEPLVMLADYYTRQHQYDLSVKTLRDAWARTRNKDIDIELKLANLLESRQRFDDALALLKTNADNARVVNQTLQCHIAANHTDEATRGLTQALAQNPTSVDLLNLQAVVYIDGNRFPEARATTSRVLQIDPHNEVGLYYQGLTEMRDPVGGNMVLALRDLSTVVTRNPQNVQYKIEYSNALQRMHDLDAAASVLEDVLRIDPYNRQARLELLNVYSTLKQWSPQFEKTVSDAEFNSATNDDPVWFREHAFALAAQGRFPLAIDKIRQAMVMDPHNAQYARDYLLILLQSRDTTSVNRETERLLETGHREWWIYHLRGIARFDGGHTAEAMEEFDKAIASIDVAKDPDSFQQVIDSVAKLSIDDALTRLAPRLGDDRWRLQSVSLRLRKEDWTGALTEDEPLLAKGQSLTRSYRLSALRFAAQAAQGAGLYDRSRQYYVDLLVEAPQEIAALNNLAFMVAENLHDPAGALQYSQRAYDLTRQYNAPDPNVVDTHGWVLVLMGEPQIDQGINLLSGLVDSNPDLLDARYHLAMAFSKKNQPANAQRVLLAAQDQIRTMEQNKTPPPAASKAMIENALSSLKLK